MFVKPSRVVQASRGRPPSTDQALIGSETRPSHRAGRITRQAGNGVLNKRMVGRSKDERHNVRVTHRKLSTDDASPTKSLLNSAMRAAMAPASLPMLVLLSCLTTAPRPSRHFFASSSVFTGRRCVPSSLSRSLSVRLVVLSQLPSAMQI